MRKFLLSVLTLTIVATACSAGVPGVATDRDPTVDLGNDDIRLVSRLVPFQDCVELLGHLQSEATERVGPYGLEYSGNYWGGGFGGDVIFEGAGLDEAEFGVAAQEDSGIATSAAAPSDGDNGSASSGSGNDFTATNVQELGVDEPDIIKTDGDRILVIADNTLTYVDISGDEPVITDQIRISEGWGHELFFQGDRALLFTNDGTWGGPYPVEPGILDDSPAAVSSDDAEEEFAPGGSIESPVAPPWFGPSATIIEVDLSDPTDLEVTSTLRIQGEYLSARRVGDTVRLALNSAPTQLQWVYPSSPAGEDRAERFNRELIEETTIEDWIPAFELSNDDGITTGPLLDCDRLNRPAEFSGFDIVSVLSFNLDNGLSNGEGAGVLASGRTVYASTDRFYVATTAWAGEEIVNGDGFNSWEESYKTNIHGFSIGTDDPAEYVASGMVEGSLLNQFSMDEYDGYLRILTTDGTPWSEQNQSETKLTVFAEDGDSLVQVGQGGGIGKGESLFSARLMDEVGFAVTFRQIDPFYVLDLSDPTDPKVAGELKIPGVSTYLHPIGENLVLGVGQDGTDDGRLTGLKVSLFNVSDPSDPREVAVWTMPNANSAAEYDHKAFQFLPEQGIAILPVQSWSDNFSGAVLLQIGDETITELGRVSHLPDDTAPKSDCEVVDPTQFGDESELFWMAEGGARVQFCDELDNGGYGSWYCDQIPVDDLRYYFGDESTADALLNDLTGSDPNPEDRIEICWPDGGNYQEQIQRSLVVGDDLWTMSSSRLQSNNLIELNVQDVLPLS